MSKLQIWPNWNSVAIKGTDRLLLTLYDGGDVVSHVGWELSQEVHHGVVLWITDAQIHSTIQQCPHYLNLAAERRLVQRRPSSRPHIDV